MKKLFLFGLLFCGHVMNAMHVSLDEPVATVPQDKETPTLYEELRKELFSDTGYYSKLMKTEDTKNIFVIIGSNLEECKIKNSIEAAEFDNVSKTSCAFFSYNNNRKTFLHGRSLQTQKYDILHKTFNLVDIRYESTLLPLEGCKQVIFCINKESMALDTQLQASRIEQLIDAARDQRNKHTKFCFIVDEEGLDTRAYPLLKVLCDGLKAREPKFFIFPFLPVSMGDHNECIFGFMDQQRYKGVDVNQEDGQIHWDGTVEGRHTLAEYYLIDFTNKCMPLGVSLKNILFSKSCLVVLIGACVLYYYKK